MKRVLFEQDLRAGITSGVEKLARLVKATLGPSGNNIAISKGNGVPLFTKDGVTVAKHVDFKDKLESLGARMIQEVANKADNNAGDGTTTATVLAEAIYKEGVKLVATGVNPISLKREIWKAAINVVAKLKEGVKDVNGYTDIFNVANISTNSDGELAEIIAKAFQQVGVEGSIIVEGSGKAETTLDFIEGLKVQRGYQSNMFVNNTFRRTAEYNNPYYLIINDDIDDIHKLVNILGEIYPKNPKDVRPLIIAVADIKEEPLVNLIALKKNTKLPICVIKTPGFGNDKADLTEDFAQRVNATVFDVDLAPLKDFTMDDLGTSERVIVTENDMTIIDGAGDIEPRIKELKGLLENTLEEELAHAKLKDRIAGLSNGIACIKMGAQSDSELKDKKLRAEDALNATRAAIEEGIVAGGGVALFDVKAKLEKPETAGEKVVFNVLDAPLRAIVDNTHYDTADVISEVKKMGGDNGFDAATGTYVP
jgi:chaperonin GroEL